MWLKIIGAALLACLFVALELTGSAGGINVVNLVSAALIFLIFYDYFWEGLVFAGVAGFLTDFFSTGRFGLFFSIFILFALALNVVMYIFFGAKSLITFAVFSFFGVIIYDVLSAIIKSVAALNFSITYFWQNLSDKLPETVFTFIFIFIIYLIVRRARTFKKTGNESFWR